ncbi:MAG TPA: class I SAM-dependent methyltransferase [Candidatus Andersenbacteria bacterium]|nr:class I SAM-dependent methyltransferase [Candidatus Andersenbacteria bacterium]
MPSILSSNYLARFPVARAMKKFAQDFDAQSKILDIGCGHKPYRNYFSGTYVGIDHVKTPECDIVADSASIPLGNQSCNAIILNQTLEHTENIQGTVQEIFRLLKPGGKCFISVPMAMKVHSMPLPSTEAEYKNFDTALHPTWNVDFWRFTKFGLIVTFKDFRIVSLEETSGYIGTICQLINYFFASFGIPYIFSPIYVILNTIGIASDTLVEAICKNNSSPLLVKFFNLIYKSLPLNYNLIIQKPL